MEMNSLFKEEGLEIRIIDYEKKKGFFNKDQNSYTILTEPLGWKVKRKYEHFLLLSKSL